MGDRTHTLVRLEPIVLVALGGFVGATLRYAVSLGFAGTFPWGTLAVNTAGSFALGVLLYERHLVDAISVETRLIVGTGFLSSFTTYSTFAAQTVALAPPLAVANVLGNYGLGLTAVVAGRWVARWLA